MDNQLTGNAFKRDLKRIGVSIKNMISLTRSMSQLLISSLMSKFCLFCLGLKTIKLIWILNNLLITYWPGIKLSVSETPYSRFFQESRFEKRIMLDMLVSSAKKKKKQEPSRYWWHCLEGGYPLSWATWSTLYIIVVSVIFPKLPTGTHNSQFKTSRDTSRDDLPSYITDCGLWGN